ncbi:MAG: peroxiredoxin-like family protein [Opitutaceae bacterium]
MVKLFVRFVFLSATLAMSSALPAAPSIADSAEAAHPLSQGATAPSIKLMATDGAMVDLGAAFAARPTILVFYRGSWCPYCNRQLAALGEAQAELQQLGYQILAVSPDPLEGLKAMAGKNHLNYQLLSDHGMVASAAYGVAFKLSPETEKTYRNYGVTLTPLPGGEGTWLPVPTVFIIDRASQIRFVYSNPDYKIRLKTSDLVAAAKAALK